MNGHYHYNNRRTSQQGSRQNTRHGSAREQSLKVFGGDSISIQRNNLLLENPHVVKNLIEKRTRASAGVCSVPLPMSSVNVHYWDSGIHAIPRHGMDGRVIFM